MQVTLGVSSGSDDRASGFARVEWLFSERVSRHLKMNPTNAFDAQDILTPQELADWLKVPESWVFEQTRKRAKLRNRNPLPVIRLGKYVRFSREQVSQWMAENCPK